MDAAPLDGRDGDDDARHGEGHERSWRAASGLIGVLAVLVVVLWLLSLTSDDGDNIDGRNADPVDEEAQAEEILKQAQEAARRAAEKVANSKKAPKVGRRQCDLKWGRLAVVVVPRILRYSGVTFV